MSSVAIANHILGYNKTTLKENRPQEAASSRADQTRRAIERDGRPPEMHQQPINFGDKENSFFKSSYGPTTREAVNPDTDSYYRQNANINTIKRKKPKTPDYETSKPSTNGSQTAANDVINEFRNKYMPKNGGETGVDFMSPRPSVARNTPHQLPPALPAPRNAENQFSFVSNDYEDQTQKQTIKTRPKGNPHSDHVIEERGNAIPIDEVLNTYKSSRSYKEPQPPPVMTSETQKVPEMSREEVEKEKRRNEELNARLRGQVYRPPPNQHLQHQHIYQSLKYKDNTKENASDLWGQSGTPPLQTQPHAAPSNKGQIRYVRKASKEMDLMNGNDNGFSFAPEVRRGEENMSMAPAPRRSKNGFTISPRAEELARAVNQPSPVQHKKTQSEENNYVLSEATEKKFDRNQVLDGYKSKHIYKNNETSHQGQNPAERAKQQFEEKNQRNVERERSRMEKLNSRLYKDNVPEKQVYNGHQHPSGSDVSDRDRYHNQQNNDRRSEPVYNGHNQQHVVNGDSYGRNERNQIPEPNQNNIKPMHNNNSHNHTSQRYNDVDMNNDDMFFARDESVMKVEDTPFHHDIHHTISQPKHEDEPPKYSRHPQSRHGQPMEVENHYKRRDDVTPEPKVGPTAKHFRRGQANTQHQSENDGWVRMEPQQKVNPGPSTQALNYFHKNENEVAPSFVQHVQNGFVPSHAPPQRTNSSTSNPNVTFGKKNGTDILTDYQHEFKSISPRADPLSKSDPSLFGNDVSSKDPVQNTDLNQLNFSNLSSNLRRSRRDYSRSFRGDGVETNESHNTAQAKHNDQYLIVDNTKMPKSQNRSFKSGSGRSRSTLSSNSSYQSFSGSTTNDKNRTTVMLARGWSGTVVSSSNETQQKYDYNVPLKPEDSGNMNNLVFRNFKPIDDVKPTDRKKDALSSLSSLDRRLRSESGNNRMLFDDAMDWMTSDDPQQQRNPNNYREANFPVSELPNLNNQIKESGYREGQDMRVTFYESLHHITGLVNQILEAMPRQDFPFKLSPTSYQGDFEKKGPQKIDLYINIEDLQQYDHQVNFLIKDHLAAYVIMQSNNREYLKQFCARNRKSEEWVLSSGRVMMVFSHLMKEKVRHLFEWDSEMKRNDIIAHAQVKFSVVSDTEVRLHVSFPGSETVYDVGLLLAFDVKDFPNIMQMNKNRQWPDSEALSQLMSGGTHLLAQPGAVKNHAWAVSFLKTRKVLLNYCDGDQTATSILLALQVINKSALSNRSTIGLLLPVHFIMILFWVHQTYRDKSDWNKENMSKRFIDVLIALKRCLERKVCPDFFFPKLNYFEDFTTDKIYYLLENVKDVLDNPTAFLNF